MDQTTQTTNEVKLPRGVLPKWTICKDGGSYFLDGPIIHEGMFKYTDRRGEVSGWRDALEAVFKAGYEAGRNTK